MAGADYDVRLSAAAAAAKVAEARGEDALAAREWRRYRLIVDVARDPEELLVEGVALSVSAQALVKPLQ
jgi:hypothetical protein